MIRTFRLVDRPARFLLWQVDDLIVSLTSFGIVFLIDDLAGFAVLAACLVVTPIIRMKFKTYPELIYKLTNCGFKSEGVLPYGKSYVPFGKNKE